MNHLGQAFRFWCRKKRIERPPATWDMHLIGRGDSDSKNSYPVLASGVKAAHCKPILFYLSEIATEIASHCKCVLVGQHIFGQTILLLRHGLQSIKFDLCKELLKHGIRPNVDWWFELVAYNTTSYIRDLYGEVFFGYKATNSNHHLQKVYASKTQQNHQKGKCPLLLCFGDFWGLLRFWVLESRSHALGYMRFFVDH